MGILESVCRVGRFGDFTIWRPLLAGLIQLGTDSSVWVGGWLLSLFSNLLGSWQNMEHAR
jgi:hypothetical protein